MSEKSSEEDLAKEFLLCPIGPATTDRSQSKRPANPSQTANGKGMTSPLMAAALPKSRKIFRKSFVNWLLFRKEDRS